MNSQYFCSFRSMFFGVLVVVALFASTPCLADVSNDDLDSILNAPAMPATNVYLNESTQNDVFTQANALASRVANMYRDVLYQAYPAKPDATDIKVVCTVTVRDGASDDVLSAIKTTARKPFGNPQALPVPLPQVPSKLADITGKLATNISHQLSNSQGKSVEVMLQIKRNDSPQCTVAVSADRVDSGRGGTSISLGVSFVSQDEALANVTDIGYPANNDQSN